MARAKKDGEAPKKRGRPPGKKAKKAAAAPETKAKAAPQPQPSTASTSGNAAAIRLPVSGTVSRLVKQLESRGGDIRTITSEMGELVAKAVENKHVDKRALRWVRMIFKSFESQPKSAALSFNHLLAYLDELEIPKLADDALGMDLGEGGNGDEEPPEDQGEDHLGERAPGADEPPAEQPASGRSPGLKVVPGAAAPDSEVPSPDEAEKAA